MKILITKDELIELLKISEPTVVNHLEKEGIYKKI